MKNSSERKRYKTNPNFDAYLLYSYIQMKRNASDKRSRDKADKLIYEYLNNYIMYELYYSYRSTLEKCEFQELYQSLWVEVLADLQCPNCSFAIPCAMWSCDYIIHME